MTERRPTPEELWDAIDADAARAEKERIEALDPEACRRELADAGFDLRAVRADAERVAARIRGETQVAAVPNAGARGAPSARRSRAVRATWLVAAALACLALALVWWRAPREHVASPITPDTATGAPPPAPPPAPERAAALRAEAAHACEGRRWVECLAELDHARELDPAGDEDAEVQRWRRVAGKALGPTNEGKPPH